MSTSAVLRAECCPLRMNFDTSMQQGRESAMEGTTYAVQFRETASGDLKHLLSFPRRASGTCFSAMTITLLISWLVALTCQEPNRTVGTILV